MDLTQVIQLASAVVAFAVTAHLWRETTRLRAVNTAQAIELARLREQNAVHEQLTADAAAQATIDAENAAELLQHLQAMRSEVAALKARQ